MAKAMVKADAVHTGVVLMPWDEGYDAKADAVDLAAISKQLDLGNERKLVADQEKDMSDYYKSAIDQRRRLLVMAARAVALTTIQGNTDAIDKFLRILGNETRGNKMRDWLLKYAPVTWDRIEYTKPDGTTGTRNGFVVDKRKRTAVQKQIAGNATKFAAQLVSDNAYIKSEQEFRPIDVMDSVARLVRTTLKAYNARDARKELADKQGKDHDNFKGIEKLREFAKQLGITEQIKTVNVTD